MARWRGRGDGEWNTTVRTMSMSETKRMREAGRMRARVWVSLEKKWEIELINKGWTGVNIRVNYIPRRLLTCNRRGRVLVLSFLKALTPVIIKYMTWKCQHLHVLNLLKESTLGISKQLAWNGSILIVLNFQHIHTEHLLTFVVVFDACNVLKQDIKYYLE